MVIRLRHARLALLCAPLLALGAGAALAADKPATRSAANNASSGAQASPPGGWGPGFGLDANRDGSVDLSELTAREPGITAAEFGSLDIDHDGLLSRAELRAALPKLRLMRIDTNKDGLVSADELRAEAVRDADAMFKRLDKDGNGQLTAEELHHGRPGPGFGPMRGDAPFKPHEKPAPQ